jgi:hypothetical protein
MFQEYIVNYNASKTSQSCILIDSEFEENFIAVSTPTGLDIFTPIIKIYEERELNVPFNLVKLCVYLNERFLFKIPLKEVIKSFAKENILFAKYKKDTEKYFVLL